jgi:hypothetical protein
MKQSFHLPRVNLNYEKFNIRFQGADIWNSLDESIKSATLNHFKKKLKAKLIREY